MGNLKHIGDIYEPGSLSQICAVLVYYKTAHVYFLGLSQFLAVESCLDMLIQTLSCRIVTFLIIWLGFSDRYIIV